MKAVVAEKLPRTSGCLENFSRDRAVRKNFRALPIDRVIFRAPVGLPEKIFQHHTNSIV